MAPLDFACWRFVVRYQVSAMNTSKMFIKQYMILSEHFIVLLRRRLATANVPPDHWDYLTLLRHHPRFNDPEFPLAHLRKCAELGRGIVHKIEDPSNDSVLSATLNPLWYTIKRYGLSGVDRRRLKSAVDMYARRVAAPASVVTILAPVTGFDTGFQRISLPNGVRLRRWTVAERRDFIQEFAYEHSLFDPSIFQTSAILVRRIPYRTQEERQQQVLRVVEVMRDCITALRLVSGSRVGLPHIFVIGQLLGSLDYCIPQPDFDTGDDAWTASVQLGDQPRFQLGHQQRAAFRRLVGRLGTLRPETRQELSTALSRYNRSCSRRSEDDRIIDLTIALESILLRGISQELRYRFKLIGGYLIGRATNDDREFRILEELYDRRSSIVHGNRHEGMPRKKKNKFTFLDYDEISRRVVSEAIARAQNSSLEEVIKAVEEKIRSGAPRRGSGS